MVKDPTTPNANHHAAFIRWFVLEGSTLKWYKSIDTEAQTIDKEEKCRIDLNLSMICRTQDLAAHRFSLFQTVPDAHCDKEVRSTQVHHELI